jgi:hypothetical protein
MTLGPALIVLACLDGVMAERGLGRILLVFGRVPLFYYVVHIFLISRHGNFCGLAISSTPSLGFGMRVYIVQPVTATVCRSFT